MGRSRLLIRRFLLATLFSFAIPSMAQKEQSTSACVDCHRAQSLEQAHTPMGSALELPGHNPTLATHPKLTVRKGAYTYLVETIADNSTYSVTDGVNTLSAQIHWSFGYGAQTWFLERNGQYYESLVSYYPAINGLDTTTGDESLKPKNLEEALGRKLNARDPRDCFGCHSTNSWANGKLNFASLEPGVTCDRCHSGAITHLADALRNDYSSVPAQLNKLSSEDLSEFCGQCHRTWEKVVSGGLRGMPNVRFQPYRLANSRCFDGTDPRIGCVACHDVHHDLVRNDAAYDAKCLACHSAAAHPATNTAGSEVAKSCPVAKSNCVSCHMPKVKLPGGLMTFTDHQIRIVKPGESYPN